MSALQQEAGAAENHGSIWGFRRLWSLADMQNFVLSHFTTTMKLIDQEISICYTQTRSGIPKPLSEPDKERINNLLRYAADLFTRLELIRAPDRLHRLNRAIRIGTDYLSAFSELKVLKEAIEDDIALERFYKYPKAMAELPISYRRDWAATVEAFPQKAVDFEIRSGVDCYALGHPTAAIFHFMRVVEYGLRALAKRLKVKLPGDKAIEWSEWRPVLAALRRKIDALNQAPRGRKKADELDFYSGAQGNFEGFKDMFRDNVMHVRREYQEWEAEMAMRHVRDFMNKLSTRVAGKKGC